MKNKIVFALFGALCPLLAAPGQAQTQTVRPSVPVAAVHSAYALSYVWMPVAVHAGRSEWRWVLHPPTGASAENGELAVSALAAPALSAYLRRLPAGSTLEITWQFRQSYLTHNPSWISLQRLCAEQGIGVRVFCFSDYMEPAGS